MYEFKALTNKNQVLNRKKMMTSMNTIVTTVIILLFLSVLLSGCIGEKKATPAESLQKEAANVSSPNLTPSSKEENKPEISIASFSSIYMHDNFGNKTWASYNISEGYYAAYNLTIKNNGKDSLYFTTKELRLQEGDRIFNTTATTFTSFVPNLVEVLSDLGKENKIQDTTLLPGQSLSGTVVFRVDSLYNESFLLMYNTSPVTSASFEKSIDALWKAENFDYSIALGLPPYSNCHERGGTKGSYVPIFDDYCDTWANWVNRSIFETFQKSDLERMQRSPPDNIPLTKMAYALRVFPEKNITMFPVTTREFSSNLLVIDDTGKKIINTSEIAGVAVLSNQTYAVFKPQWKLIMPRMNFSNIYIVQISFEGTYMGSGRVSFSNQDVILDEDLNIIAVRYYPAQFLS